jgi:hypothetical protein
MEFCTRRRKVTTKWSLVGEGGLVAAAAGAAAGAGGGGAGAHVDSASFVGRM